MRGFFCFVSLLKKKLLKSILFFEKTFEVSLKYLYLQTNVNLNFLKSIINFNLILSK